MSKPKFQKPAKNTPAKSDQGIDEFAQRANEEQSEKKARYPWEEPGVRDENKMLPLYLPEPVKLKLKYLSEQTGVSQQRIMREILIPGIEDRLKDVL